MTSKTCSSSDEDDYCLDPKKYHSRSPSPEDAVEAVSMSSAGSVDSDEEEEEHESCSSSSSEEEDESEGDSESETSEECSTSSSESEESAEVKGDTDRDNGIPFMVQINTAEDSLCGESQTSAGDGKPKSNLRRRKTDPGKDGRGVSSVSRRNSAVRELSEGHLSFSRTGSSVVGGNSTASGSQAQSVSVFSANVCKRHTTASGLPPSCQLRDAQFLKINFPESHWAPDINELDHLESLMNVQCTMVCSYDPSIRETFWVTLTKVMRKKRASGTSQICVGYVKQNLKTCDLPRGSQVVLLPKHVQKVDSKSAEILFQKLMQAEQRRKEMERIRPVLPGGGPIIG